MLRTALTRTISTSTVTLASIITCILLITLLTTPVFAQIVVVDGDNPDWGFVEEVAAGVGSFADGPGTPPQGAGSAQLSVDSTGRIFLGNAQSNGVRLDQLTSLSYWTYRSSGSVALAISLQLNIDYDLTDGDTAWQGRLVFEPANDGATVNTGVWQQWDALAGTWWASGAPGNTVCTQGSTCTISQVLANFPEAGVHATLGAVLLKAGGPWAPSFFGATDALRIGINGVETLYDFEEDATTIFLDGFESGNTAAWSDAVGGP